MQITRENINLLKRLGYTCNPLDNKNSTGIAQILENSISGIFPWCWKNVLYLMIKHNIVKNWLKVENQDINVNFIQR